MPSGIVLFAVVESAVRFTIQNGRDILPTFRFGMVHFMEPGYRGIQSFLVAVELLGLDFLFRSMFNAPGAGPDIGSQIFNFFLAAFIGGIGLFAGDEWFGANRLTASLR